MAKVKGVKEKLHMPLYDAFVVPEPPGLPLTFSAGMTDPRMIRFFVDVQNKTRLETNLQASGVLPSQNTFEARALRVVASIPPIGFNCEVLWTDADDFCKKIQEAKSDNTKIKTAKDELCDKVKALCAAADTSQILSKLIYNSVVTLLVGEKVMVEAPTYVFPAGAGVSPGNGIVTNHGEPDPMATFRFSEPVIIEPQQNFRVEMLFPQGVPTVLAGATGPLRIWTILDGYLTRDVQ